MTWADLPASVQQALTSRKIDAEQFPAWVKEIRAANEARLRDGNYDHLIHYALQSTRVDVASADRTGAEREGVRRVEADS